MSDVKTATVTPEVQVDETAKTVAPGAAPLTQPVQAPEATPVKPA
jgi:hypothetical protein